MWNESRYQLSIALERRDRFMVVDQFKTGGSEPTQRIGGLARIGQEVAVMYDLCRIALELSIMSNQRLDHRIGIWTLESEKQGGYYNHVTFNITRT